jgi:uncharacterized protein (TIGR03000 family)
MYTVVIMTALAVGGDAPLWGRHDSQHGGQSGWFRNICARHNSRAAYGCMAAYGACGGYAACSGATYYGFGDQFWCDSGVAAPLAPRIVPLPPVITIPQAQPEPPSVIEKRTSSGLQQLQTASVTARLIIDLPADARLYINGQLYRTRTFRTPALEAGKPYYYVVRAEIVRDGKTESETRYVAVGAGTEIAVSFPDLSRVLAAK